MKNPVPMSQWTDKQWKEWEEKQEYDKAEEEYINSLFENWLSNEDEVYDYESYIELPWTDEHEAALEEWEEQKRIRYAESNEY